MEDGDVKEFSTRELQKEAYIIVAIIGRGEKASVFFASIIRIWAIE